MYRWWGKPAGRAPRGPSCDLCCGREDSPRHFRPADPDAILFLIWRHADPLAFRAVQNIVKMDARTPGWLGWMLRTSRHIVIDCREQTNEPAHYSKMSCVGGCFAIAGSISKHQRYQVMHSLLLLHMLTKDTVDLSTYIANIPVQWPCTYSSFCPHFLLYTFYCLHALKDWWLLSILSC